VAARGALLQGFDLHRGKREDSDAEDREGDHHLHEGEAGSAVVSFEHSHGQFIQLLLLGFHPWTRDVPSGVSTMA